MIAQRLTTSIYNVSTQAQIRLVTVASTGRMYMNIYSYLLFFVPVFASMIVLEYQIGRKNSILIYTKSETIASFTIALGQNLISILNSSIISIIWIFFYQNRIFDISALYWWYFPVIFVTADFLYYWYHRLNHEIRWLWATHSVHHSTEEMNFLAGYRFGWTERVSMGHLIYSPLFLVGFHPNHLIFMLAINIMYQSWLHTNLIGKLGWLEGIVNTPSAHRVHHGKNADYLDRNLGGIFMIWDRIFGTYVEERDKFPVEYGLIKPSGSTNPVRIAFHEWINITRDIREYRVRDWPMLLFGPPGWAPNGAGVTSAQLRDRFRAGCCTELAISKTQWTDASNLGKIGR